MPSKEKPGTEVIFAPYGQLLDYVDNAYEAALKCKSRALTWIRAKDQYTRGEWNDLPMKGWSLGDAMSIVKVQTKQDWTDYRNHGDTSAGDWDGANAAAAVNSWAMVPWVPPEYPK